MGTADPDAPLIKLNGQERLVSEGLTVLGLLAELDLEGGGVAVAVNHHVVPRGAYPNHLLCDGDAVEVIRAVGGG